MNTPTILQTYIQQTLLNDLQTVDIDDDLLSESVIDSMGIMQLIAFIETKFDCKVPQSDITIANFRSIQAIAAYLGNRSLSCQ